MRLLKQFFTWWNGETLATRFYTWRKGNYVGQDDLGNRYYKAKSAVPGSIPERRWVIYKGYSEGSQVGPGWHGWLHHRTEVAPPQENYVPREWQKPHEENLTGTAGAYHPPGSIAVGGKPMKAAADYQAWKPQ
ncbi:MAG TPA: NADH:ubiquinone oxidoreductase subunit NDUFA12 [Aestuariivirga sp.]